MAAIANLRSFLASQKSLRLAQKGDGDESLEVLDAKGKRCDLEKRRAAMRDKDVFECFREMTNANQSCTVSLKPLANLKAVFTTDDKQLSDKVQDIDRCKRLYDYVEVTPKSVFRTMSAAHFDVKSRRLEAEEGGYTKQPTSKPQQVTDLPLNVEEIISRKEFKEFLDRTSNRVEKVLAEPYDVFRDLYAERKAEEAKTQCSISTVHAYTTCRFDPVTSLAWSGQHPELFLASVGKLKEEAFPTEGSIHIYNLHLPGRPDLTLSGEVQPHAIRTTDSGRRLS